MKKLICEMCEGTDLVKDGGVFVCRTCGCKYSVEEARKKMMEEQPETQLTSQPANDQGKYGEADHPQSQGKYGEGKIESTQKPWICPECETKNTGSICVLCGYQIKLTEDRKTENTVEPVKMGKTARKGKKKTIMVAAIVAVFAIVLVILMLGKRNDIPEIIAKNPVDETESLKEETVEKTEEMQNGEYHVAVKSYDGMQEIDADYLKIQVKNERDVTVTISGIELEDTYITNLSTTGKNSCEYSWCCNMLGRETYTVSTAVWAYNPGAEEEKTLEEMQHSLFALVEEDGREYYTYVCAVKMTHTENSITWTFNIPDEYEFNFGEIQCFTTSVDVPDKDSLMRTYVVDGHYTENKEMHLEANSNILMVNGYTDGTVLGKPIAREDVLTITFLDTVKDAPTDAWDVSANQDKRVLAWTKPNGQFFDLYIAGEGGVRAPENCTGLFQGYFNAKEINFNNCFDTSDTSSMAAMFSSCRSISSLDIAGFDTTKVWNMSEMFYGCTLLSELDISDFDTSNVTYMSWMFAGCDSLESIELRGFDTSNVTTMNGMFSWCKSLSNIDVSGFNTSKVKNMCMMFDFCENLASLEIDCWDLSSVEEYDDFMEPNAKINGRRWQDYFEK